MIGLGMFVSSLSRGKVIAKQAIDYYAKQTIIQDVSFAGTSLPVGWLNDGAFTLSDGASKSGTGGYTTNLYWDQYSTLDRASVIATVQVNDAASQFRLFKKSTMRGTLAEVNCATGKLIMYNPWDNINATTPLYEGTIPFSFVAGRAYEVELKRFASLNYFGIKDTVTGEVFSISNDYDNTPYYFPGSFWGNPGIQHVAGDIKVTNFKYVAHFPETPKIAIYGDSITEGYTLQKVPDSLSARWADKVYNSVEIKGNGLISGRGGDRAMHLFYRMRADLDFCNPKYCILAIGSNDSDYATWYNDMQKMITKVENNGAIPILTTVPPRTDIDYQAAHTEINNWVLSQGTYNVIDFAAALTINGDRITQNMTYFQDETGFIQDNVHPNTAGHQAMYDRVILDAPYLFN